LSAGGEHCGDYALASRKISSISIINISTPASPSFVRSFTDLGGGVPVYITTAGSYGFVSCGSDDDLVTLDLSDPSSPSKLGQLNIPVPGYHPIKSLLYGSSLFMILEKDSDPGTTVLACIDVSDPSNPSFEYQSEDTELPNPYDISIARHYGLGKNLAFVGYVDTSDPVADRGNIEAFELTDPDIFQGSITEGVGTIFVTAGVGTYPRSLSYRNEQLYCTSNGTSTFTWGERLLSLSYPNTSGYQTGLTDLILMETLDPSPSNDNYADESHEILALGNDYALYNSMTGLALYYGTGSTIKITATSLYGSEAAGNTTGLSIQGDYVYLATDKGLEVFKINP
jgi:hypothetical protein